MTRLPELPAPTGRQGVAATSSIAACERAPECPVPTRNLPGPGEGAPQNSEVLEASKEQQQAGLIAPPAGNGADQLVAECQYQRGALREDKPRASGECPEAPLSGREGPRGAGRNSSTYSREWASDVALQHSRFARREGAGQGEDCRSLPDDPSVTMGRRDPALGRRQGGVLVAEAVANAEAHHPSQEGLATNSELRAAVCPDGAEAPAMGVTSRLGPLPNPERVLSDQDIHFGLLSILSFGSLYPMLCTPLRSGALR